MLVQHIHLKKPHEEGFPGHSPHLSRFRQFSPDMGISRTFVAVASSCLRIQI